MRIGNLIPHENIKKKSVIKDSDLYQDLQTDHYPTTVIARLRIIYAPWSDANKLEYFMHDALSTGSQNIWCWLINVQSLISCYCRKQLSVPGECIVKGLALTWSIKPILWSLMMTS